MDEIVIVGAGIGGLTLGLMLHESGIPCRVVEQAPAIQAVGVGINILPHATRELSELGLEPALAKIAVATQQAAFFNRFGQLIYKEPLGRAAGYEWPQFSVHRGDLQRVLLDAFVERAGSDRLHLGHQCTGAEPDGAVHFRKTGTSESLPSRKGYAVIACDGIHSAIRKQLYPQEGEPRYSGVNMWRGITVWEPILDGAAMIRAGWLTTGKMVIYPIRNDVDGMGRQLVNWVAEIETPSYKRRDWNRPGRLEDFIGAFSDWHFEWADVPALIRAAEMVLEFPMVDQDPLPRWSSGRLTLLGDAAHPMVPRGSNGAGQAILDARALTECVGAERSPEAALKVYEDRRLQATANVVLANRETPPDAILGEVFTRTGDKPFGRIEDVISEAELKALSEGYKRVAGYDKETLGKGRPTLKARP